MNYNTTIQSVDASENLSLDTIIKMQSIGLKCSKRDFDIAQDITEKAMASWNKKYKCDNDICEHFLLMSMTNTGSFAISGDTLYFDNYMDHGLNAIAYSEIERVTAKKGGAFTPDIIELTMRDRTCVVLDGSIDGLNIDVLSKVLALASQTAKKTTLSISKQHYKLYELPDELKLIYLKILCNYAYLSGKIIDPLEYNAINKFAIRMEIDSNTRKELRYYMNNLSSRIKTGYLLKEAKELLENETGKWDAFRYSLVQDVLFIHNINLANSPWQQDGFVGSLINAFSILPEQVDTMEKAVILNQKMQEKNADIKQLKQEWKAFVKQTRYTKGYVPTLFLFCSGSIYGIDNYTALFRKDDDSEEAVNKYRELVLYEIIQNNQKLNNVLADDMNYLAERLQDAINESHELKEEYKLLIARIKQASELNRKSNEEFCSRRKT